MALEQIYQRLQRNSKERAKKTNDKIPMKGSKWLQEMRPFFNLREEDRRGELLRVTFLSDGTLSCSRTDYLDSLPLKAKDIVNGIIITDNELVYNSELYHLYFEVDWKDKTTLPTEKQIQTYLQNAYNIVKECYPEEEDCSLYCLQNSPYLKEKNDDIFFATGLHIIFPGIATRTLDNFLVAGYIEKRILPLEPVWVGKTDLSSYHDSNGNLRPAYAYKMLPCPTCTAINKNEKLSKTSQFNILKNESKNHENDTEENFDPIVESIDNPVNKRKKKRKISKTNGIGNNYNQDHMLSSHSLSCTDCYRGKVIDPNFYDLRYQVDKKGKFSKIQPGTFSILDVLLKTTLFLHSPRECSVLVRPNDMGSISDLKSEQMNPKKFNNLKGTKIEETEHNGILQFASRIVCRMISQFNSEFAFAHAYEVVQKKTKNKNYIIIKVRGKGSGFCLRIQKQHASNHVYYILSSDGTLKFQCHNDDCKQFLLPSKSSNNYKNIQVIQIKLTVQERQEAKNIFGFGQFIPQMSELKQQQRDRHLNLEKRTEEEYDQEKETLNDLISSLTSSAPPLVGTKLPKW